MNVHKITLELQRCAFKGKSTDLQSQNKGSDSGVYSELSLLVFS